MKDKSELRWAVGITTVPVRRGTLFPKTLASIRAAGFPDPWLFVDGAAGDVGESYRREWGNLVAGITCHDPPIRIAGNWVLALYELFYRYPSAERYAIFQDDLVCCKNLRKYLERVSYPDGVYAFKDAPGYPNLYTAPSNQEIVPADQTVRHDPIPGWFKGHQLGKGAVALVFSQEAVVILLSARHLADRPKDLDRGWRLIDGGISSSMTKAGWTEYVHHPSLVKHEGKVRSWHSHDGSLAGTNGLRPAEWLDYYDDTSFPGEDFDALCLLGELAAK